MNEQQANKQALKILMKAREDFQMQRKRMDNRIGRKADGDDMDIDERVFRAEDLDLFVDVADESRRMEKKIERKLTSVLKRFDVYTEWLIDVKGVGPVSAAQIISQIDIHIATTVSKIWQYSGMNPSKIRGKKRVQTANPKTYQPKKGKVLSRKDDHVIVLTDEMIRGDKLSAGFISPYNKHLKTALLGVMADSFLRARNSYALDYYYPMKERLKQSDKITNEVTKGGKVVKKAWKDCTPNHQHRAAIRYMVKMFLSDLYNVWRSIEGLDVRAPYQEEYLGHKHTG